MNRPTDLHFIAPVYSNHSWATPVTHPNLWRATIFYPYKLPWAGKWGCFSAFSKYFSLVSKTCLPLSGHLFMGWYVSQVVKQFPLILMKDFLKSGWENMILGAFIFFWEKHTVVLSLEQSWRQASWIKVSECSSVGMHLMHDIFFFFSYRAIREMNFISHNLHPSGIKEELLCARLMSIHKQRKEYSSPLEVISPNVHNMGGSLS